MANKHTSYDLAQMQSLPLRAKIIMTKQRIRQWYEYWDGMVYVAFSGGKDSTVLKHIVDSMYDDVPALFVNTGLEFPEIQKFAMSQKNVVTVRPEMRFDEVLKKYGYPVVSKSVSHNIATARRCPEGNVAKNIVFNPDKSGFYNQYKWRFLTEAPFLVSDNCCYEMKKKPSKVYAKETGRKPILGTLASESKLRYQSWLKNGCNAFDAKNQSSQPLSFWTEQDILHYLKKYNVPYCSVYGEIVAHDASGNPCCVSDDYIDAFPDTKLFTTGYERTGCVFCAFGCHLQKEPNNFQRLKETHPRQYEYCINGGEWVVEGYYCEDPRDDWEWIDFVDYCGNPLTKEEIESYVEEYKDDPRFKFVRKWQPSKEGLGLGKVLDYIGVKYD